MAFHEFIKEILNPPETQAEKAKREKAEKAKELADKKTNALNDIKGELLKFAKDYKKKFNKFVPIKDFKQGATHLLADKNIDIEFTENELVNSFSTIELKHIRNIAPSKLTKWKTKERKDIRAKAKENIKNIADDDNEKDTKIAKIKADEKIAITRIGNRKKIPIKK